MKKSSIKAFTLIELLVVVAIIGILAAVGVVSFQGFTGSAKQNAAKSNHAAAVKSISAEIKKCEISGGSLSLKNSSTTTSAQPVPCSKTSTTSASLATSFVNHLNNEGFKNPYDTQVLAFEVGAVSTAVGRTAIVGSGSGTAAKIDIYTKWGDNTGDFLQSSIADER